MHAHLISYFDFYLYNLNNIILDLMQLYMRSRSQRSVVSQINAGVANVF